MPFGREAQIVPRPCRCYSILCAPQLWGEILGTAFIMVTKRQLGIIFILLGLGAAAAMFVMDVVGAGQFQGIGPAQRRALVAAAAAVVVGLSLLPLGDRPA